MGKGKKRSGVGRWTREGMKRESGREVNKGKELGQCREVNGKGSEGKGGSVKKMKGKGSKREGKQVHRVGQKGKDVMR